MTTQELLIFQIQVTANQIERALDGLNDSDLQHKLSEPCMNMSSILEHLCECRVAFLTESVGNKHSWGTYEAPDRSLAGLRSTLRDLTNKTIEIVKSDGSDEVLKHASDFLVLHDAYHVGQLCATRLSFDREFDPYSIYKMPTP
jgi:uncharacterized damage-inducible protein DinB